MVNNAKEVPPLFALEICAQLFSICPTNSNVKLPQTQKCLGCSMIKPKLTFAI